MGAELAVVVVMEAFDGRVLDGGVYPLDLSIGPRVVGLRKAVLNAVGRADHVEAHEPGIDSVAVPGLLCELDALRHCLSDQWHFNASISQMVWT